jgi:hypothetical protein
VGRITLRQNSSPEFWILMVVLLFTLFVVVPWLIRHPPADRHVDRPVELQLTR